MNHPSFSIAGRMVGYEYPPLVIAEIGINHEGSLEVAKAMVDAAHRAGAEIVKHQTHIRLFLRKLVSTVQKQAQLKFVFLVDQKLQPHHYEHIILMYGSLRIKKPSSDEI